MWHNETLFWSTMAAMALSTLLCLWWVAMAVWSTVKPKPAPRDFREHLLAGTDPLLIPLDGKTIIIKDGDTVLKTDAPLFAELRKLYDGPPVNHADFTNHVIREAAKALDIPRDVLERKDG